MKIMQIENYESSEEKFCGAFKLLIKKVFVIVYESIN
jgi:hypothetical protein